MGRIVKIWDKGTKGDSKDLYRAPNGKYYSSEEAYSKIEKRTKERQACIDLLKDIFGYEEHMKPNTYIFKLLSELEPYGYDVVYDTIKAQEDNIIRVISGKSFFNEIGKIKYVFAIINNNIMDVYKQKQSVLYNERKSAKIIEIEDYIPHKQHTTDISRWLDDED